MYIEVERIGATLNVGSGSDFTTVAGSALSIYSEEILELMADVTQRSSFPESELDLARENTKQMLIQQRAQPTFLASERIAEQSMDRGLLLFEGARLSESIHCAVRELYRIAQRAF